MRINLYVEELTTEVAVVSKDVYDKKFGDRTFYGIRMFLKSPEELHSDPEDDDRSAITFWVPATTTGTVLPETLNTLFNSMLDALGEVVAL